MNGGWRLTTRCQGKVLLRGDALTALNRRDAAAISKYRKVTLAFFGI